jgi:hypothetical protein
MNRLQRVAILMRLGDELRAQGSWCGETHLQKATFFLQELLHVPLEFDFILYKHGPFSFDLRDEISAMHADNLIKFEPQVPPYGPRIVTTDDGRVIQERFPRTIGSYNEQIGFVAQRLGDKGVLKLEEFATAIYVTRESGCNTPVAERASRLKDVKAHISPEQASVAIQEIDKVIQAAGEVGHPH